MVILVPFDGSTLARTALLHASRSSDIYKQTPLVVTVIPNGNTAYARRKGWLTNSESFDTDTVVSRLREQVAELAPDADFEYVLVDEHAPPGTMSSRLRQLARTHDAVAIFVGSENAGHSRLGTQSVAGRVVFEKGCDIAVIRNPLPEAEANTATERVS